LDSCDNYIYETAVQGVETSVRMCPEFSFAG